MRPGRLHPVPPSTAARMRALRRPARARAAALRVARLALAGAALWGTVLWGTAWTPAWATAGYPQAEVTIHGHTIRVDVADTPASQSLGLGGRAGLAEGEGMLFVYAQRERHTFWMRGMLFPIDMIWLDNRRVVHIAAAVPPPQPGMDAASLPTYEPPQPANFVLELAAGRAAALGLRVGDEVRFRFGVR